MGMYHSSVRAAEQARRRGPGPLRGRGRIEDGVDGARLQGFVGFTSFRDIHPGDLVHETSEVAAGQLAMDDWPDHASLPNGV